MPFCHSLDRGKKPDGFFAINDAVAVDLIDELNAIGVRVPDDCCGCWDGRSAVVPLGSGLESLVANLSNQS